MRRSDPSKDSPHLQPHHVAVAVAFLSFFNLRRLCFSSVPLPGWNVFTSFSDAATSRLCSAGESVTSSRRCRRFDALSSLGLCSPSRTFPSPSFRLGGDVEQSVSRKRDLHCTCSAAHPSRATGRADGREDQRGNHDEPKLFRYLEHDIRRCRAEYSHGRSHISLESGTFRCRSRSGRIPFSVHLLRVRCVAFVLEERCRSCW